MISIIIVNPVLENWRTILDNWRTAVFDGVMGKSVDDSGSLRQDGARNSP
jgi:hypothetical protein